jgi:hypothetical protein
MRTHVDTAAAIRRKNTDLFAHLTPGGEYVSWEAMSPRTAFFDENEDEERIQTILRTAGDAEVVRVTRVIDIVEIYRDSAMRVAVPN